MKTRALLFATAALMIVACTKNEAPPRDEEQLPPEEQQDDEQELPPYDENPLTPDPDFRTNAVEGYSPAGTDNVFITFSMTGEAQVNNLVPTKAEVNVDGQHVTVKTLAKDVNFVATGTTGNGSLKFLASGSNKFNLILNGASITNPRGAAINNQLSKTVSLTLLDGTNNRLIDGATYDVPDGEDMKGTFFSEGQLVVDGAGSLLIYGNCKHALCVDDYIQINSGTITVNNSASDGVHCNKYFRMDGGSLTVEAYSDCIESEKADVIIAGGAIRATSTRDKGKCLKAATDITVTGGTLDLRTNGAGGKCIGADGNVAISGGVLTLAVAGNAYYDTEEQDIKSPAGIHPAGNLVVSGDAALTIASVGTAGKGISVDGDATFEGGSTTITTSGAIYKYSSSLHSSAKGVKADGALTVNGGRISVKTTKDGAEGLESKATLTINGGTVEIEAYDDGMNGANNVTINGGEVYSYSAANDGVDSNGTLTITGGTVVSVGAASPEEGLDCDNHTLKITGGLIVGIGGATSAPTSSVCTQRVFVWGASSFTAGQYVAISSANGADLLVFRLPRAYNNMALVFSSPALEAGTACTVYKGGSASGGSDFHGLLTGASYIKGTAAATFSFSGSTMVVTSGTTGSPGGGGPGGGRPF
ncbi:MAG: carbohydrate-binding domain-containing protein [Rikenellaceae bacterium]|jgi:hypothetical protein|nr:carbohydrate-binding domain-containing protein [Rikenellaceae bacterium]